MSDDEPDDPSSGENSGSGLAYGQMKAVNATKPTDLTLGLTAEIVHTRHSTRLGRCKRTAQWSSNPTT